MATLVSSAELARRIGVTRPRISQLVSERKLEGTYTGSGRERLFNLEQVAAALNMRLSLGQASGNGAKGLAARANIAAGSEPRAPADADLPEDQRRKLSQHHAAAAATIVGAKAEKAKLEVLDLRRRAAAQEGRWVLAEAVEREAAQALAAEVAEFEGALRFAARRLADRLGVDFREAKGVLAEVWREHRARRAAVLGAEADAADFDDDERQEADT